MLPVCSHMSDRKIVMISESCHQSSYLCFNREIESIEVPARHLGFFDHVSLMLLWL